MIDALSIERWVYKTFARQSMKTARFVSVLLNLGLNFLQ